MNKEQGRRDRRDELNIARLGIISIQSRFESDESRFLVEFQVEGRDYRVECLAPDGRPHGIDTDVLLAVETLFVWRGSPPTNWLYTTAYEILALTGLPDNGRSYARLRESLRRLWSTGFVVGEGWRDAKKGRRTWTNETLRYLERIRYRDQESEDAATLELDGGAPLGLKLSDQLADSIREGYTQILSGSLLLQLEQPPARALYRLLEAHRTRDEGGRNAVLSVRLEDWRRACGLITERPDNARRTLEAAHEELRAVGYLAGAHWTGRGKDTLLEYRFAEEDAPDPALVALLTDQGVAVGTARALVRDHAPHVEEAITFLQHSKERGYKVRSNAAMLVDYLRGRGQGKYAAPDAPTPLPLPKRGEAKEFRRKQAEDEEGKAQEKLRLELEAVAALPRAEQWEHMPGLRFLLRGKLTSEELRILESRAKAGQIEPITLYRELVSQMGKRSGEAYLEALRARLRESVLL